VSTANKRAVSRMKGIVAQAISNMDQLAIYVENTSKAGESLTTISSRIAAISDISSQIATATEEQGIVVEKISRNIHIV
jgi:methyl-accepting chemotaxis protein